MKQVVQNNRTGELKVVDVPAPLVKPGGVLVRNVNSVVSLGTEKLMMDFAKKSLVGKALARPDLTKQVIDLAKTRGVLAAYREAINRLDVLTPLGYSSAGVVIDVGEGVREFSAGERVSCARSGVACHAEVIFVPKNLCVKIPDNVSFESGAFAGLGAIALHAVRLAGLGLGEKLAVIGVGLLGQIAVQLASAAGCSVFAVDVVEEKVSLAQRLGAHGGAVIGKEDVVSKANGFTKGYGFDAVIILASTKSNQPLELAAEISRERGKIVAPGVVGLNVPRETFYEKELSLIVSKAFGPGVHDSLYEIKGVDYPYSYVRWTERRNMEIFLELVSQGKVSLDELITHRYSISEAEKAYKMLMEDNSGKCIGALLHYDNLDKDVHSFTRLQLKKNLRGKAEVKEKINVGLIGAGAFARTTLLPCIKKIPHVNLRGVATATGASATHAGKKFGFQYCTTDYHQILDDSEIDCVLIATRHNLHARLVVEALKKGKDVFVEKPLALSMDELREIIRAFKDSSGRLMVGFMRRFSPFSLKAKELMEKGAEPVVINFRVNAGPLPEDSWVYDPAVGGGRIVGEVCHFVDLAQFFTDSIPTEVYAKNISGAGGVYDPTDNVLITIAFEDGSVASIVYVASGDKSFPRERIEIFGNGAVCVIDNFKKLTFSKGGKRKGKRNFFNRDMGYRNEFSVFFSAVQKKEPMPVDLENYALTTLTTFGIEESLTKGAPIKVDLGRLLKPDSSA